MRKMRKANLVRLCLLVAGVTLLFSAARAVTVQSADIAIIATSPNEIPLFGDDRPTDDGDIIVIGERTGPRMWRVTKDDAEIFVLVSVQFVPDDLEWDDRQVARVLAEVEEVLVQPKTSLGAGNRTRLIGTMIRTLIFNRGRIMMPKEMTLADRVGSELADRFDKARARVDARLEVNKALAKERKKTGDDERDSDAVDDEQAVNEADNAAIKQQLEDIKPERLHPFFQAQGLIANAIDSANLTGFDGIEERIVKLSRKVEARPKPKVRPIVEYDIAFRDIKQVITSVKDFADETNRLCLEEAINFADEELFVEAAKAQAWARGDAVFLRANATVDPLGVCGKALSKEIGTLKTFGGVSLEEIDGATIWVNALEESMRTPGVRLAIISADSWLRKGGAMDRLIEAGYSVSGP